MEKDKELIPSGQFLARIEEFREGMESFEEKMRKKYKDISKEPTPQVDGQGQSIIGKKGGYDYIIEAYIRDKLDYYFPGWSWENPNGKGITMLGSEGIIAEGDLVILDRDLLLLSMATNGAVSPYRRFHGVGFQLVTFKQNQSHTMENLVDVNVRAANSSALKYAVNRMCRIGDDVYKKRIDWEEGGTIEEYIEAKAELGGSEGMAALARWQTENKVLISKMCAVLGVKALGEVKDFGEALRKVKEARANGEL